MMLALLFAIGFISAFLQSGIGFGAAVIMMNILPFIISTSKALAVSQFTCISFSLYVVIRKRNHIRKDVLIPVLIPSLICTAIATRLSAGLDVSMMKILLGILFIALSAYFSFLADRIKIKPTNTSGMIVGAISGTMNGLFGTGGPPAVLYMTPALSERDEYIATSQTFFMTTNIISLTTRILSHAVVLSDINLMAASAIGGLLGSIIGIRATKKLNGALLKRFIYAFIGINGFIIIINQLAKM